MIVASGIFFLPSLFFLFFFLFSRLVMENRYEVASFKSRPQLSFFFFFLFFFPPKIARISRNRAFFFFPPRTLVDLYATPRERGLWIWFINIFEAVGQLIDLAVERDASFCIACAFGWGGTVTRKMWFLKLAGHEEDYKYKHWGMVGIKELKIFSVERNRYTSIVENFLSFQRDTNGWTTRSI